MSYDFDEDEDEIDIFMKMCWMQKEPITFEEILDACRNRLFDDIEMKCQRASDMWDIKYII